MHTTSVFCALLALAVHGVKGATQSWVYTDKLPGRGPRDWGAMPGADVCGTGKQQSPVDVKAAEVWTDPSLESLEFHYADAIRAFTVHNLVHSLEVVFNKGEELGYMIDPNQGGRKYIANRMRLHLSSEHMINGQRAAMEMQIDHTAAPEAEQPATGKTGTETVMVALLFVARSGTGGTGLVFTHDPNSLPATPVVPANAYLDDALVQFTPSVKDVMLTPFGPMKPLQIVTQTSKYHTYEGSMTAPPCTEGVRWYILDGSTDPAKAVEDNVVRGITQDELDNLRAALALGEAFKTPKGNFVEGNFRPVQPLSEKAVRKYIPTIVAGKSGGVCVDLRALGQAAGAQVAGRGFPAPKAITRHAHLMDGKVAFSNFPQELDGATAWFVGGGKGLAAGDEVEVSCCEHNGCDFFVSTYNCRTCHNGYNGGINAILMTEGWVPGSCAPKFTAAKGGGHPMVTFKKHFAGGQVVKLPALESAAPFFFVSSKAHDGSTTDPAKWCMIPHNTNKSPQPGTPCSATCAI